MCVYVCMFAHASTFPRHTLVVSVPRKIKRITMSTLCGKKAIAKIARRLFHFILILVTRRYTLSGDKRAQLFIFGFIFGGFVVGMHTLKSSCVEKSRQRETRQSDRWMRESRRRLALRYNKIQCAESIFPCI